MKKKKSCSPENQEFDQINHVYHSDKGDMRGSKSSEQNVLIIS